MENNKMEFLYSLEDLGSMYVDYISKNDDSRLEVIIQDNKICMYLYKDKEVVDEFELTFEERERNMYIYVSVIIMKILFEKIVIMNKDNVFFNYKERKNLKVIVNDEFILDKMITLMNELGDAYIYGDIKGISKVNIGFRHTKLIRTLKQRVDISKRLLGVGE